MKKLIFLAITHFLVCFQSLNAQEISATSKVTEVSVYRNLAKETRSSSITIPAGQSEIVLTGVTMQMMDQSLQVSVKVTPLCYLQVSAQIILPKRTLQRKIPKLSAFKIQ